MEDAVYMGIEPTNMASGFNHVWDSDVSDCWWHHAITHTHKKHQLCSFEQSDRTCEERARQLGDVGQLFIVFSCRCQRDYRLRNC